MARVKARTRRTISRAKELKWKPKFLAQLAKTCCVSRSARLAGVGRRTVYEHYDNDSKFARDWDEAIEIAIDALAFELRRRALQGVVEPRFYKGKKCGSVRRYSDDLGKFLMEAHRPERYRANHKREQQAEITLADLVGEAEARAEARKREREAK